MNTITKWFVKLIPLESLLESAFDSLAEKANEAMKREGRDEVIKRFTSVGADISKFANDTCEILKDARISDEEKEEYKKRFIPILVNTITKALD